MVSREDGGGAARTYPAVMRTNLCNNLNQATSGHISNNELLRNFLLKLAQIIISTDLLKTHVT